MNNFSPETYFDLSNFTHAALFKEIDYVWDALKKIEIYLHSCSLGKILGTVSKEAYLIDPHLIYIGEGTVVEAGAYIKGPCILGKGCSVRHGAYIRGALVAGDKCVIGHDTEVKNSIFLNGAQAAHFAYVGDSILGSNVNLGAGTVLANLKFDHSPIKIKGPKGVIDTHLKKFGAILGDAAQMGCNSVSNPGTLLGKGAFCYPCVNVSGVIGAGQRAKPAASFTLSG